MRKTFTEAELADPERGEQLSARCCALFMEFATQVAERRNMDVSKLIRLLLTKEFSADERKALSALRAHL